MDVAVQTLDTNAVVTISGEADARGLKLLEEELSNLSRSGAKHVILDLRDLSYIASPGVAFLVRFHDHFEELGGCMALANLPPRIQGIFQVTKLASRFLIFGSVKEAQAHFVSEGGKS